MTNQTMTVQEVATALGVTDEAIKWQVKKFFPELMQHGKKTYLTEIQVTTIKQNMKQTSQLASSVTDLEMYERALSVQNWALGKIEEQRKALEEAQPKIEFHDSVTDSSKCFGMSETAQLLNLGFGRNKLYTLLKAEKILKESKEPYQQYIEQGYFKIILKSVGHGGQEIVTLVTGKGLTWLQKKYSKPTQIEKVGTK